MVTNFGLNSALVLAQLNLGTNSASLLGIFLAVAGAGLYFLRSIRPELARDQDIFFAAVGLLCGGILLTQGWRLDPILQFSQFLLAGSTAFFAYEAIRLRGVATEQAKRNTRIVDDERKVSKVYRYDDQEAELYDRLEPEEDEYISPRLRGTADPRNSRAESYEGEVRRSSRSRSASERTGSGERQSKRRSRPTSRASERPVESLEADVDNSWEDEPPRSSRQRQSSRPESRAPETSSRPKRRRPPQDRVSSPPRREEETAPSDYVDYQPIDSSEEESDKPGRFDY